MPQQHKFEDGSCVFCGSSGKQFAGSTCVGGGMADLAKLEAQIEVEPPAKLEDMAMLMRLLINRLRRHEPESGIAERALLYLNRKGLTGSPLRSEDGV